MKDRMEAKGVTPMPPAMHSETRYEKTSSVGLLNGPSTKKFRGSIGGTSGAPVIRRDASGCAFSTPDSGEASSVGTASSSVVGNSVTVVTPFSIFPFSASAYGNKSD